MPRLVEGGRIGRCAVKVGLNLVPYDALPNLVPSDVNVPNLVPGAEVVFAHQECARWLRWCHVMVH